MDSILKIDGPVYRLLSRIVELILLNILFILCCLPVITIGASITALFSITLKMVKGEEGGIINGFWKAFKKNFKQSTLVWGILSLFGIILALNYFFLQFYTGKLSFLILMGLVTFSLFFCVYLVLLFPYIARYNCTIKEACINVIKISIANMYFILLIIILILGPGVLMLFSPLWLVIKLYMDIFIGFSFIAYASSFMIRRIFEKYET
ncbi:YesL family protein [Oceanobacillus sp. FSL W7-1281]|uniref:YesL family protein n=1 Tax=Oceanobacillus sp. FSL W7-1281 TaxID=2921698 RepID=UPI0030D75645